MPNPYPATFEVAENLHVRLDGDVTFTDPANQPGGGGGGQVNSVTAGDASITIAGTVTDPTVAVAALGVTAGKIASNAVTQAKLAANAVGAAQMDSGAASANWVPVADGTGGVVYAASPGVNSLTAADTSVVVGGTASSPTVRTGTLDTIATQHPPTAAVALNSQKITGLANGTVATDAAAFGQIPTALPPNGSAGGDLSGTYPNPTVAAVQGVAVSGTAPTANQVLTASDATHAAWATPTGSSPLTTKGDLFGHSTVDARIPVGTDTQVLTADSTQALGVKWATPSSGFSNPMTTKGDIIIENATPAPARLAVGSTGQLLGVASGLPAWTYPPGYEIGYDQTTSSGSVTSTTEATPTTIITCSAHTFDGGVVLLDVYLPQVSSPSPTSSYVVIVLFESTTEIGRMGIVLTPTNAALQQTYRSSYRFTPSAGSHTYTIGAFASSATGGPGWTAGGGGTGTAVPGFARFTKV